MINVRKLRVLQRKGDAMERQKVVEKTRKYLASVGDRIKAVATQERTRRQIWQVRQIAASRRWEYRVWILKYADTYL